MIVSCYPRSGSSWYVRVLSDAFDLYLTNKDETYKNEGFESRYEKAKILSKEKDIAFIDKSHYASYSETTQIDMNIDNKFLFLYRDPRDAILSYFYFVFFRQKKASKKIMLEYLKNFQFKKFFILISGNYSKITFEDFFKVFAEYQIKRWKKYYIEWSNRDNVLALRYEDILNDTIGSVKTVSTFFSLEYDENRVQKSISKWDIESTKKAFADTNLKQNERMVRSAKYGEWKEKFSDDINQMFIEKFKDFDGAFYKEKE